MALRRETLVRLVLGKPCMPETADQAFLADLLRGKSMLVVRFLITHNQVLYDLCLFLS